MRQRNWRLIIVGVALIIAAAAFFVAMERFAPSSNDPVGMLQTVGQVSGVVAGLALVMVAIGAIGRVTPS